MSILHSPWLKLTTLSLFAAIILTAAPVATHADPVTFAATTSGCFGAGCTGFDLNPSGFGLTFMGSTNVGPVTSDASSNAATLDLGSFTLNAVPDSAVFTLQINFTEPAGMTAGQSVLVRASISGVRDANGNLNMVDISFNKPIDAIFFAELDPVFFEQPGITQGSFQLRITDLTIELNQTVSLTGQITNASQFPNGPQTPEPATLGLLATGLGGLIGLARRRRKRAPSAE